MWLALGLLVFGYMVVWPTVDRIIQSRKVLPAIRPLEEVSLARMIQVRAVQVVAVIWFLVLGGAFGSFLNVLAGSLPRGEAILLRSSRCPHCGVLILRRDNLPMIGYLVLGGRCRACQNPISPRYLIVEIVTAAIFMSFFVIELISGGKSLPERNPNFYAGIVWILLETKWDLVGIYSYHTLLICALLAGGLIQRDGFQIRWSWKIALAIGFLVPAFIWPKLHVVPIYKGIQYWESPLGTWLRVLTPLVGGVVGWMVGWLLRLLAKDPSAAQRYQGLTLVGIVMGWQGALGAALINLVVEGVWKVAAGPRRVAGVSNDLIWTMIAAWSELLVWVWLYEGCRGWWPTAHSNLVQIGSFLATLAAVAFFLRSFHISPTVPGTNEQVPQSSP